MTGREEEGRGRRACAQRERERGRTQKTQKSPTPTNPETDSDESRKPKTELVRRADHTTSEIVAPQHWSTQNRSFLSHPKTNRSCRTPKPIVLDPDSLSSIAISPSRQSRSQHRTMRSRLRLHRAISPLVEPSRNRIMNFFSWVLFVFLDWGMKLYICLAAEKMWAISRKCVFYGIFNNTTKHHKIFFTIFSEMQQNT